MERDPGKRIETKERRRTTMFLRNGLHMAGRGTVMALAGLVAAGCAHVHQDDLETELEQLRAEMREADEQVEEALRADLRAAEDRLEARMSSLENELVALGSEFDEFASSVERFESAIRFNSPVHFDFDDDTLRDRDREILDRFAEVVEEYYRDAVITVEGFTDPAGNPEYNMALGERRAQAVKNHLVSAGLSDERLKAVSYGEAADRQVNPGAHGPGQEGWENRRAAMVIDFRGSPDRPAALRGDGEDDGNR